MRDLVILWLACASFGLSAFSCWLAARAYRGSAEKSPAKWNTRLAEVANDLLDLTDRVENLQETLRKASARRAGRARIEKDGQPDPWRDPEAWKQWVNAGGIAVLKGKKGAE